MSMFTKALLPKKTRKKIRQIQRSAGIPRGLEGFVDRTVGNRNRGLFGLDPRHSTPVDGPMVTAHADPRALGPHRCVAGAGQGRRGFSMKSLINVAGGALAVNTDLGDFFDADSVDFISTDGEILQDVEIKEASMMVHTVYPAAALENPASVVGAGYLILRANGEEVERYGLEDFNPLITMAPANIAGFAITTPAPVPFEIEFDPDVTYALVLRLSRAVTTVGITTYSMSFKGTRLAGGLG